MINSWKSKHWNLDRQPHIGDLARAVDQGVIGERLEWLKAAVLGQTIKEQKMEVVEQKERDIVTLEVKERMAERDNIPQKTKNKIYILIAVFIAIFFYIEKHYSYLIFKRRLFKW